jgi:hypothetical protein
MYREQSGNPATIAARLATRSAQRLEECWRCKNVENKPLKNV